MAVVCFCETDEGCNWRAWAEAFAQRSSGSMYRQRPKCEAVVHLHSTHSVAVSCLDEIDHSNCIPPITAYYTMRVGKLPLVPYLSPGDQRLAAAVEELASKNPAVLLANHGPVVAGTGLENAIYAAEEMKETVKLFLMLRKERIRILDDQQAEELPNIRVEPKVAACQMLI